MGYLLRVKQDILFSIFRKYTSTKFCFMCTGLGFLNRIIFLCSFLFAISISWIFG